MKKIKYFSAIMIAMLLLVSITAVTNFAENEADYTYTKNSVLVTNVGRTASNFSEARRVAEGLNLGASSGELVLLREDKSATGKTYRFQQYYGGYPVFGRQVVVSVNENETVTSVNGNFKEMKNVDLNYDRDRFESEIRASDYSLAVYSLDGADVLCFEYSTGGEQIFVNARTMQQVARVPLYSKATTTEQVTLPQTLPDGEQVMLPLERETESGTYYLADGLRNIVVLDAENKYGADAKYVNAQDGVFTDSTAVIALSNMIKTYDFYSDGDNIGVVGGYAGADGNNDLVHGNADENGERVIFMYVHYGENINNAAYIYSDDNSNLVRFVFGDGDDSRNPYTYALDTMAHEYQHAVTYFVSGLIYFNESGALNEAISDLFGSLVEGRPMTDDDFWLCGEDLCLDGTALRDIKTPSTYNNPVAVNGEFWQSLCYKNDEHKVCDNGGVHTNSTIISHLAYKMYAADSEFFTAKETGRLWFNTLQRMTPTSNFEDFRILMEQAAVELGYNKGARDIIATAFNDANIIASEGEHTVLIRCDNDDAENSYILRGNYGDEFVMPNYQEAKEGYFIRYWTEAKYGTKYYAGEKYTFPAYDMTLIPNMVPNVWNGCALTEFTQSGEMRDPIIVKNAADLASLAYYANVSVVPLEKIYVRLEADIDLLNVPWIPIGLGEENASYYNFDGNGHKISNLVIDDTYDTPYAGLFGVALGSIENLGIESGKIETAASYAGGIVGLAQVEVTFCYNKAEVINTQVGKDSSTGGVAGCVYAVSVSSCYNVGNVSGNCFVGGVVGRVAGDSFEDSNGLIANGIVLGNNYNTGEIRGAIVGGVIGSAATAMIVNSINTGKVVSNVGESAKRLSGGIAGRLNIADDNFYGYDNKGGENTAVLGCKNAGVVESEGGACGGLVGLLASDDTTGNTLLKNNVYKAQGELAAFGVGADAVGVMGDVPKRSTDEVFTGDFDFDNAEYYADRSRWYAVANVSIFDSAEWSFEANKMPVHKEVEYWIDFAADSFDGGDGTESAPYRIRTAEQLARLAYITNNFDLEWKTLLYFKLTADIDLKGKVWVSIGVEFLSPTEDGPIISYERAFRGHFDGNGHTISHLSARTVIRFPEDQHEGERLTSSAALFGVVDSYYRAARSIKNIKLTNVNNISKGGSAAGLVGLVRKNCTISECEVDGVILGGYNVGGVVGEFSPSRGALTVSDCYSRATVSGNRVGGILGISELFNNNRLDNCTLTVKNCVNTGNVITNVYSRDAHIIGGGIVGHTAIDTLIDSCISDGEMAVYTYRGVLGGFIGTIEGDEIIAPELNVQLLYCKMSGEFINYGQTLIESSTVGKLISGEYTVNLTLQNCATTKDSLFAEENKNGIATTLSESDCAVNAAASCFDYNNIEYFFDRNFWEQDDAHRANGMYEFFGNTPIRLTVTFKSEDGTTFAIQKVKYGEVPTAPDGIPTKASTAEYEYTFSGWGTLAAVTGDASYTANFKESAREYTVTFKNEDGTTFAIQKVKYGEVPPAPDGIPTKASTAEYEYAFSGWGTLAAVTGDVSYTANFKGSVREYTVTFKNEDGTTFAIQKVKYGEVPTAPDGIPTKASTAEHEYTFSGWGTLAAVTGDASYTANFTESAIDKLATSTAVIVVSTTVPIAVAVIIGIAAFVIFKKSRQNAPKN